MSSTPAEEKAKPAMPGLPPMESKGVLLADRHGNKFYVGNAGDLWMPAFKIPVDQDYRSVVKGIRDMEVRDGDILVCSYPKTGTNWNTAIIGLLMSGSLSHQYNKDLLEMSPMTLVDQLESPRMLNTHLPVRYCPQQAFKKKIKIVLLNRNPKDTIVSWYNHQARHSQLLAWEGTFEHFFDLQMELGGLYGDHFDYNMEWQDAMDANPDAKIYMSTFEDMKLDPVGQVVKLNEFLETGRSVEFCEQVAKECQFDTLKKARENLMPESVKGLFKDNKPAYFRKGEVGDWKNWFTVSMNERFDAEYTRRMSEYRLTHKYTL